MKLTPLFCSAALAVALFAPSLVPGVSAAGLSRATVTNIQEQVWIVPPSQEPRSASVGSVVSGSTAVRTGVKSLAEITFTDQTLLRLGSNTQFSFQEGLREVNLRSGTALFQVPKGSGGLRVRTGSITAAITGSEAKVKAPAPGEPGAFLLLNLHGTMRAEFEDASFADGDIPKPLPTPRGLARLFSGPSPSFSVKLAPGQGFYAWVDPAGRIVGGTVKTFMFDLKANIGSGRLTKEGGVTEGTNQAAGRQSRQMGKSLVATVRAKPLPGSFQSLGTNQPLRTVGRDQGIVDQIVAQRAADLAAQQALAAQIVAANAPSITPSPPQAQPGLSPAQRLALRRRQLRIRQLQKQLVVIPEVIAETPAQQPEMPAAFDPSKLDFCQGVTGDLPYPANGANSNCLEMTGSMEPPGGGEGPTEFDGPQ